jgi:hypothetical protein
MSGFKGESQMPTKGNKQTKNKPGAQAGAGKKKKAK